MASKRKTNGCASLKCVMEAVNKIGCEVHDFFAYAQHVVDVPEGFHATREALLFNRFRNEGVAEHPHYEIPRCILDFADTIHSEQCPKKFFTDLQARIRASAQRSARESMQVA